MSAVASVFCEGKKAIFTRAAATITAIKTLRVGQTKRFTASSMMTTRIGTGAEDTAFPDNALRGYGGDVRSSLIPQEDY